jgi:hypothetical protein
VVLCVDEKSATHNPGHPGLAAHHLRFCLHFTRTGSSCINQTERWFGYLTYQRARRSVHKSVQALETDVCE